VRRAQSLLETADLSIEQVATEVGFSTATTFRDRFFRTVGLSPTAYRKAFGAKTALP
jgi:transcriptional regulator GlxA family with amidase domain